MGYTVAVVGATGAVGSQMIKMLEESSLPIDKIRYLASARSAGKVLQFKGQDVTIEETTETAFEGVDIALFSAGGSTSAKYAPYAVKAGADIIMLDNMDIETTKKAIKIINKKAIIECSGNVDINNINRFKGLEIDYISSGAITHSAKILDLSLKKLRYIDD